MLEKHVENFDGESKSRPHAHKPGALTNGLWLSSHIYETEKKKLRNF